MSKENPVSVSCLIKIKVGGIEKEITRGDACELLAQLRLALDDTYNIPNISPYPQPFPFVSPLTPTCGSVGTDLY